MDGSITLMILLQVFLITLNAIFASTEIAVISLKENKLDKLLKFGDKRAIKLATLKNQPARFLATIQVAITLSGYLGSAFAAENFSDGIASWLISLGIPLSFEVLDTISVIVVTLILSYFTLIFGELVPKRIAMKKAESLSLKLANLINTISIIFKPIVSFLTFSTNLVLKILGIDPNSEEDEISEEEIRMLIDVGNEKGAIDHHEKEFIQNVFEFDDLSAGEIATHRTKTSFLWLDKTVSQWEEIIHNTRHTLYPVCDSTVDNIIGILNAKDYFRLNDKSMDNVLKFAVTPAYFVPESVKADVLFKNMKYSKNYLSIVIDEYGGVTGIITINDLLEQLVGDLNPDEIEIFKLDDNKWQLQGSTPLETISNELGIIFPSQAYDTFNGFVLDTLGLIPDDGTILELSALGMDINSIEFKNHKVISAIVSLKSSKIDNKEPLLTN